MIISIRSIHDGSLNVEFSAPTEITPLGEIMISIENTSGADFSICLPVPQGKSLLDKLAGAIALSLEARQK